MKGGLKIMEKIKFYSTSQVAQMLSCSKKTILNAIKDGRLKAIKPAQYWKISHEALMDYINSCKTNIEE